MASYKIETEGELGLYCKVTLDDGSTFGQWAQGINTEQELDKFIEDRITEILVQKTPKQKEKKLLDRIKDKSEKTLPSVTVAAAVEV